MRVPLGSPGVCLPVCTFDITWCVVIVWPPVILVPSSSQHHKLALKKEEEKGEEAPRRWMMASTGSETCSLPLDLPRNLPTICSAFRAVAQDRRPITKLGAFTINLRWFFPDRQVASGQKIQVSQFRPLARRTGDSAQVFGR